MKKFLGILVVFAIAAAFSFSNIEAKGKEKIKESPCQKTCAAAFVQCKKDAKKDKEKIAACNTTKKECMDQCEKAVKEEKEGKGKDKAKAEIEKIEEDVTK